MYHLVIKKMNKKITGIFILTLVLSISMLGNASPMNNVDPETPEIPTITGPSIVVGVVNHCYNYTITSSDPQNDDIYFVVRTSDCPAILKTDWFKSGGTLKFNHCWGDFYQNTNTFKIHAKAVDSKGHESGWGELVVKPPMVKDISFPFSFLKQIIRTLLNRLIL